MTTMTDLSQSSVLVYPKLLTLDRLRICVAMNNRLWQHRTKHLLGNG